jgi:hypothetical protein
MWPNSALAPVPANIRFRRFLFTDGYSESTIQLSNDIREGLLCPAEIPDTEKEK